jgi:hypothetical protein
MLFTSHYTAPSLAYKAQTNLEILASLKHVSLLRRNFDFTS